MRYQTLVLLFAFLVFISCKNEKNTPPATTTTSEKSIEISYAQGFSITDKGDYKIIEVTNPWPEAGKTFRYALVKDKETFESTETFDAIVQVPVQNLIVTSTTHIPSLDMLGETDKLIAFPNLDYVSSENTRKRIAEGRITEIGNNESINTENVIDLQPDVMIGFAVTGNNKTYETLQRAGIPIVFNGDWTEQNPLGKAEWIKFFGAFFDKMEEANTLFSKIETEYTSVKELAQTAENTPTVLSGALWKDIWYLPEGNSWGAKFIADANGQYLWADSDGTGSIALNVETVLEKAQNANYWIGPGQFTTYKELEDASKAYTQLDAYKNKNIYSFSSLKGDTGGVIYYELAPNRPDLVLKDLVKILHPELLPDYELYFFRALE
ncbi:ABC transporter substrate-binding protein [Planktosalinus lacus]|uniref:ABC transporter substrate-binding protein n=1 Tax=Planktosalinus lacus TaxID=1526573 RepID=A0A8J2YC06_9FLAO|nr:ABC transporter substrate-binding protein [Planktosalinus lacus]GGD99246.1 ABC transporter substrate-binding protein [Planktosalinus lacus]